MIRDTTKTKELLTTTLAHVTAELTTLGIHDPKNQKDWIAIPDPEEMEPDLNDAADRVEEWDERASVLAQLERQYNDTVRALQKIEDGAYGVCEVGNEVIEDDRLEANPAARTCTAHMDTETTLSQ